MRRWKQIVVGVAGSPSSQKALEWAGDEAVRHGSDLVLLTAYLAPPPQPSRLGRTTPMCSSIRQLC